MKEFAQSECLILRKVTPADLETVGEYRREFLEKGGTMDGCSNLRRFEKMEEWYAWIQKLEHRETCPEGWVPDTQFLSFRKSDNALVGMLDIRWEDNDEILNLFGHIGYSIRHCQRGNGYSTEQLALALELCRSRGREKVLISCHKENLASSRTILRCGGVLENEVVDQRNGEVLQRYWIHLR